MSDAAAVLPASFVQWLTKLPESHSVQFKDNEWQFWTLDELKEPTRVNKETTAQISLLTSFVAMYRAMGLTAAKGAAGKPFPYERLELCLTLATDNEDFLIVDPADNFSAWKFCPDYAKCGEVKPVAPSLTLLVDGATIQNLNSDEHSYGFDDDGDD